MKPGLAATIRSLLLPCGASGAPYQGVPLVGMQQASEEGPAPQTGANTSEVEKGKQTNSPRLRRSFVRLAAVSLQVVMAALLASLICPLRDGGVLGGMRQEEVRVGNWQEMRRRGVDLERWKNDQKEAKVKKVKKAKEAKRQAQAEGDKRAERGK
ncbi:hypothetical protein NDU88_004833 [Pleurodeles waltl]|uniref:Transmembrane protein n=1 Tax=Pleurodeles waltl TaxID=8319 RepID=A0AAV7QJD1_PLEWA|nr:hypothetical protein NDU88_004833 [Pleurodeles waltl]